MSKAEKLSQNRYPTMAEKYAFIDGYEQAEKDLELTWEDINDIIRIYEDVLDDILEIGSDKNIYIEVLNRFNKQKEDGKIQD